VAAVAALGEYEQALEDYTQALTHQPAAMAAYIGRGESHLALGNVEATLADYETALPLAERVDDIFVIERAVAVVSQPPKAGNPGNPNDFTTYRDSEGKFTVDHPAEWVVINQPGLTALSEPNSEAVVTIFTVEVPEAAPLEELLAGFKTGLSQERGASYVSVSEEPLSLNGLPAVSHRFRLLNDPDFGGIDVTGVAVIVKRDDTALILTAFLPEATYADQEATLTRIINSLEVN
jgi:tetratricopeptide (TPR) repeat protein